MNLPNELVSQFAKLSVNQNKQSSGESLYGTAVVYGGKTYVILDGSDSMTPAVTTSEIKAGERVTVLIKDHTATITGNITDPSASGVSMKNLSNECDAMNVRMNEFDSIIATKATVKELNASIANIEKLMADKASVGELNAVKATIKDLDVSELQADIASIEKLLANKISTEELNAALVNVNTLIAGKVSAAELDAVKATIRDLDVGVLRADLAELEQAVISKADITDLDAIHAEIDFLEADIANVETLVGGHLTMENIQSLVLTSSKVTVDNAFIKDAMIDKVSASKLYAGTINTNLVKLQSSDGSLNISGTLQQFKDKNGNVRIQIGKDASGDFTFALYGADGKGQLINQNGITASAIGDGVIVDDMVADNAAISGSKLDINSVVEEINESSKTIKSSKIFLDEQNQSLSVAFDSMTSTVLNTNNKLNMLQSTVNTQSTELNVAKGKIDTLITNTTITKSDGTTTQLKDEYSATVQTVNKLQTDLGSLTTTVTNNKKTVDSKMATFTTSLEEIGGSLIDITEDIESVEGNLNKVTTRVTSAEQKLTTSGLTTIIGSHYTTSADVNSLVTAKGYATTSQVTQTKNELIATFKESGGYNRLYNGAFLTGDLTHWGNWGTCERRIGDSTTSGFAKCLEIVATGANQGVQQVVKGLKQGSTYTLSAWVQAKSGKGGIQVVNNGAYPGATTTTTNVYEKLSVTFVAAATQVTVQLGRHGGGSNGTYYYAGALLTEGSANPPWSAHPNEVYDGVITLDKRGVRVEQSNYDGHTRIQADGFYVNNGTEDVISVSSSGAVFKGKVIIQSGSTVPTSTLTGTISSSQLNSSITNDISTAKSNASSAVTTANTAKSTADTASTNASNAVTTANAAKTTANTASTNASNAVSTANTASTNASNAVKTANTAKSTADTASTNASNAVTTANAAKTTANTASTNASNAVTTANTAKSTADTASTNASKAVTTANTASTNATNAVNTANTAKSTADTANTNATTALNTANAAQKTITDNKSKWDNAYNRVLQWAYGAVSGSTTINGALIQTNTILAEKLAIADFNNYADLNADTLTKYGWTSIADSSASSNPWFEKSTLARDNHISKTYTCNGGESFRIKGQIFTSAYGQTASGGTATAVALDARVMIIATNANGSKSYLVSNSVKAASTSGTTGTIDAVVTLPSTARNFYVCIQVNGYPTFSGKVRVRNIQVIKMASGELIVDGVITANKLAAGAITAAKIAAGAVTAAKIAAGTITADKIASGAITADKIASNAITAAKISSGAVTTDKLAAGAVTAAKIAAGTITADKIASGAITADKIAAGAITADMISSGYFSGNMIKGGSISATEEISFVGGPLLKGNYGDIGAGLLISAPEIHFKNCNSNSMAGTWTFKSGNVTISSGYSLIVDTDKILGKKSLYAPNGTKNRSYMQVGKLIYQTDTDYNGLLLTDTSGAYAKLACLRVEATGDMTCNSLWASSKVYAANVALTSDERLKTDIRYVDQEIQNEGESGLMSPNVKLTTKDMHEFIEVIPLASYRMKEEVKSGIDYTYYGFIAQDILYSKVGSELIEYGEVMVNDISYDDEGNEIITPRKEERLRYSENKFIAFICGALKEEIAQRKSLERKIDELQAIVKQITNINN